MAERYPNSNYSQPAQPQNYRHLLESCRYLWENESIMDANQIRFPCRNGPQSNQNSANLTNQQTWYSGAQNSTNMTNQQPWYYNGQNFNLQGYFGYCNNDSFRYNPPQLVLGGYQSSPVNSQSTSTNFQSYNYPSINPQAVNYQPFGYFGNYSQTGRYNSPMNIGPQVYMPASNSDGEVRNQAAYLSQFQREHTTTNRVRPISRFRANSRDVSEVSTTMTHAQYVKKINALHYMEKITALERESELLERDYKEPEEGALLELDRVYCIHGHPIHECSCRNPVMCTVAQILKCVSCDEVLLGPLGSPENLHHAFHCRKRIFAELKCLKFKMDSSMDKMCSICLELVMHKRGKDRRFGLLPNCKHCFCYKCIKTWRLFKPIKYVVNFTCPECRTFSDMILPSYYWMDSTNEKSILIQKYREEKAKIPCKFFKYGEGICPYAYTCLYLHVFHNGTFSVNKYRYRLLYNQQRNDSDSS